MPRKRYSTEQIVTTLRQAEVEFDDSSSLTRTGTTCLTLRSLTHRVLGVTRAATHQLHGTLDMLVLKAIAKGPLHGYAIALQLERASNDVLRVEEGSLYPALYRMERRGWLSSQWSTSDTGRRARFYRLTRSGRAQLRAETESWNELTAAVKAVMTS